jgi:thymidylate synthase ThyX
VAVGEGNARQRQIVLIEEAVGQRPLAQTDFSHSVPEAHLAHLNRLIAEGRWEETKWQLPESFLQRRVVSANYMALQRIVRQRSTHRLQEWREFIDQLIASVEHPEYLKES